MNEWKAKYMALSAGIEDPSIIKNAEKIVEIAIRLSNESDLQFERCVYGLLEAAMKLRPVQTVAGDLPGWRSVKDALPQYQICPKCNGQGVMSKPPFIAGDQTESTSSSCVHTCDVCNGAKIIPAPPVHGGELRQP